MKEPAALVRFKERLHRLVSSWATEKNVPQKIERLNALANANKKWTVGITLSVLFLLTALSIALTFTSSNEEENVLPFSQIEDISPIMAAKQTIDEHKVRQTEDIKSLIAQGGQLKKDLDSLMALPVKSHNDSLELYRKHKQLEIIVQYINEKD